MSRTEYNPQNKDFTERAHDKARKQVYPHLFPDAINLSYINVDRGKSKVHNVLDRQLGIDLKIEATTPLFDDQPIPIYVQERFREPQYREFQDLTVTKYNNASERVSEVSKIAAQWIVYGYYESTLDEIQEAICVNVPILARELIEGGVDIAEEQNEKEQDFIGIPFKKLDELGALVLHINRIESTQHPIKVDNRQKITAYLSGD